MIRRIATPAVSQLPGYELCVLSVPEGCIYRWIAELSYYFATVRPTLSFVALQAVDEDTQLPRTVVR